MLGVAFVSGTLVFADTLSNAFRNQSAKSYDDVAVAVTSYADPDNPEEAPGLSGKDLDRISAVDGVAGVYGRVGASPGSPPRREADRRRMVQQGLELRARRERQGPGVHVHRGLRPGEGRPDRVGRGVRGQGEYEVGDRVRVATNGPVKEYTLSGVFTTEDGAVNAAAASSSSTPPSPRSST
ncbi:ABC transporter permease [Streptomyces thermocarboxydus]